MLRVSWLSSQLEKSEAIDPSHDQFATRIEVLTVETIPVLVLGPPTWGAGSNSRAVGVAYNAVQARSHTDK